MSGTTAPPPPLPTATLQAQLAAAQTAYDQLMSGAKVATVSYSQGDGQKSVTYSRANIGMLAGYIAQLQTKLGYRTRSAIGLIY